MTNTNWLRKDHSRSHTKQPLRLSLRKIGWSVHSTATDVKPYRFSSIVLALYVFTVLVMSRLVDLARYSTAVGVLLVGIFAVEFVLTNQRKLHFPSEFIGLWFLLPILLISYLWADVRLSLIHI